MSNTVSRLKKIYLSKMAVNQQRRTAFKRLKADLDELTRSPVAGISAVPLEDDMFEWHCNILLFDVPQHLILFFPEEYPYKPPSAEIAGNFLYSVGANQQGKKGTQICLPMFSDYINYHQEWEKQAALGWSPGYTVQTCLLNALSFLAEIKNNQSENAKSAEAYSCPDCGHSFKTPYPRMRKEESIRALSVVKHQTPNLFQTPDGSANGSLTKSTRELIQNRTKTKLLKTTTEIPHTTSNSKLVRSKSDIFPRNTSQVTPATTTTELLDKLTDLSEKFQITDYISKQKFKPHIKPILNNDIFGYGLEIRINDSQMRVATPYEFLTAGSFLSMKKSSGYVQSMMKVELNHFLPLYLCSNHASGITDIFEQTVKEISLLIFPNESPDIAIAEQILNTFSMLLWNSQSVASDSCILGAFAIHRLLLWAVDTYPDLQEMVDARLQAFIERPVCRLKKACPEIGALLMLLTVSTKYRWHDLADVYMTEFWRRQTMEHVAHDGALGQLLTTSKELRLCRMAEHTMEIRRQLAYKVQFIDIAMPRGMFHDDVIICYDENLGFPTDSMVAKLKDAIQRIGLSQNTYADWFTLLNLKPPSSNEIFQTLYDALHFCLDAEDYILTRSPNGWRMAYKSYKAALKSGKISKWETELPKMSNSHNEETGSKDQDHVEATGSKAGSSTLRKISETNNGMGRMRIRRQNSNAELVDGYGRVEVREGIKRSGRLIAKRKLDMLPNNKGENKKANQFVAPHCGYPRNNNKKPNCRKIIE